MEPSKHWEQRVSLAQNEARERLNALSAEGLQVVLDLMSRIAALPGPQTAQQLIERSWQLQGFELMISTAAYADRVATMAAGHRDRIHQAVNDLCRETFPKSSDELRRLQRLQGLVYAELAGVQPDH